MLYHENMVIVPAAFQFTFQHDFLCLSCASVSVARVCAHGAAYPQVSLALLNLAHVNVLGIKGINFCSLS